MTDPMHLRQEVIEALSERHPDLLAQTSAAGLKMAFNAAVAPELRIETPADRVWTITLADPTPTSRVRAAVADGLGRAVAVVSREFVSLRDDRTSVTNADFRRAPLFDEFSRGRVMQFRPQPDSAVFDINVESLTARSVDRLTNLLPSSPSDDASIETVAGARMPSRRAVIEVARAAKAAGGLTLKYGRPDEEGVNSIVTASQARTLNDLLSLHTTHVIPRRFVGILDGARSARRQFFLTTESHGDIIGIIDEPLVAKVFANLRQRVEVSVEETRSSDKAGRRSRPAYRLTGLNVLPEEPNLFDD